MAVITLATTLIVTAESAQAGYVSIYRRDSSLSNYANPHLNLGIAGTDPNSGWAGVWSSVSRWQIVDHPPNGHTIQEFGSEGRNRCLDSNHNGDLYGIQCNGGAYQRWHIIYLADQRDSYYGTVHAAFQIVNVATGRCLDANRTYGYTLGCNGGNNQRWFDININD